MEIKNSLGYMLGASTRLIKRRMDKNLEDYGITTSQWAVLKLLAEQEQLTQKQIADGLSSDKATVGEIIKLLNKKGYVEKVINSIDKRAFIIRLTSKAKVIVKELESKGTFVNEKALKGFNTEETEQLRNMLNRIIANMSGEVIN